MIIDVDGINPQINKIIFNLIILGMNNANIKQTTTISFNKQHKIFKQIQKPEPKTPSTQSTMGITSGSTGMPTTTTTATSKQTADSQFSTLLIISIVAGLITFIILIAILIYCLCCRKKEVANNKEEDEEDSSESEVENSEVFENYQKKQQPSLITIAERNKPPGEITTDWIDYETIVPKKKTNVVV